MRVGFGEQRTAASLGLILRASVRMNSALRRPKPCTVSSKASTSAAMPCTAEQFKVQDGLMFDAVRFGDAVEVLVQSVDGLRTIVSLLEK